MQICTDTVQPQPGKTQLDHPDSSGNWTRESVYSVWGILKLNGEKADRHRDLGFLNIYRACSTCYVMPVCNFQLEQSMEITSSTQPSKLQIPHSPTTALCICMCERCEQWKQLEQNLAMNRVGTFSLCRPLQCPLLVPRISCFWVFQSGQPV